MINTCRSAAYCYIEDYAIHTLADVTVDSAASAYYSEYSLDRSQVDVLVSGQQNPSKINGTDEFYHVDWSAVQTEVTVTNDRFIIGATINFST